MVGAVVGMAGEGVRGGEKTGRDDVGERALRPVGTDGQ